jgi:hypothetical protein
MFAKFVRALAIGIAIGIAIGLAIGAPTLAQAQQLIGSYVALLSEADHFNSSGQRLSSAAAIIRQDRAIASASRIPRTKATPSSRMRETGPRSNKCSNAGARSPASSPAS